MRELIESLDGHLTEGGPIFDATADREAVAKELKQSIKAPWVEVQMSTMGGRDKPILMVRLSLDPKDQWENKIFQNSRYAMISVYGADGVVEMFQKGYRVAKKMRKSRVKSLADAARKINKWVSQNG